MISIGQTLGPYTVVRELSPGGMANLFLARLDSETAPSADLHPYVMVKAVKARLSGHQEFVKMFLDEARIASRIYHPNVVRILHLDETEGTHFLVMQYVYGLAMSEFLGDLATSSLRLVPHAAVPMIAGVAAGLHAAHETCDERGQNMGIVHRDVSPQNILLPASGPVKIIDFGIAKARDRLHVTAAGSGLKGKLRYMAPEQLLGTTIDRRADIYSLAVVAWETLTMRRLFQGKSDIEVIQSIQRGGFPPPGAFAAIPHELDQVIMAALSPDPAARPATAAEFGDVLLTALPRPSGPSAFDPNAMSPLLWAVGASTLQSRSALLSPTPIAPSEAAIQTAWNFIESTEDEFTDARTAPVEAMIPRFQPSDAMFKPEYLVKPSKDTMSMATLHEVLDEDERTLLRMRTAQFGKIRLPAPRPALSNPPAPTPPPPPHRSRPAGRRPPLPVPGTLQLPPKANPGIGIGTLIVVATLGLVVGALVVLALMIFFS